MCLHLFEKRNVCEFKIILEIFKKEFKIRTTMNINNFKNLKFRLKFRQ